MMIKIGQACRINPAEFVRRCIKSRNLSRPAPADRGLVRHGFDGSSRSAFTLIEIAVVMVIIGIISTITLEFLGSAAGVYVTVLAQRRADGELMDAIERMRRESRTLRAVERKDSTLTSFSFVNANGETVRFTFSDSSVMLNDRPLARGVAEFEFNYFDSTNMMFDLPLKKFDAENVARVQLAIRITNNLASSATIANLHLREGYLK